MSARRIIHLISSLESGGCENMLLRTLPLLTKDKQTIVTLFRRGGLADQFEARGIPVVDCGMQGLADRASYQRLITILRDQQPSLILTYLFHADLIGRLVVQRQLTVPVLPFLRTTYNFARYLPARVFEWLTKQWTRHYLANSEAVKAYYVRQIGVRPEQITVVPNGIDVATFDRADGTGIIRELRLPEQRFVITCVANFAPNKGHRYLLEAVDQLVQRDRAVYVLLVGSGHEEQSLRQQAQALSSRDRILFLGRRSDVPNILATTNVFVLPTLFEGMSNAVMEAMAATLPVITTDIPENRSLITDGENGLLVAPSTVVPLREALERLIADTGLCAQLGIAARKTVERHFSLPVVAGAWQGVIDRFAQP